MESLSSEMRRGTLALAVLVQCRTPQYGYSLKQHLADAGLEANEGTLYPLMRRLEEQGLLESEWRLAGESRPRRYYRLSQAGSSVLAALSEDWRKLALAMDRLLFVEVEGETNGSNASPE